MMSHVLNPFARGFSVEFHRLARCLALVSLVIGLGCDDGGSNSAPVPDPAPAPASSDGYEAGSMVSSTAGHYRISVRPADPSVTLGSLHSWIVRVELAGADSPIPKRVSFDGGMPSHGHGFVTTPRVTQNLGGGEFLVEGVKFHMTGEWELRVTVFNAEGSDVAIFPLTVEP